MRWRRLTFLLLLLFSLKGQSAPHDFFRSPYYDDTHGEGFVSVFGFASYIAYKPQPGLMTISFPYTLTNRQTGAVATDTFFTRQENMPGGGKFAYPGIGVEIGRGSVTVEASLGMYLKNWSDNLYFGCSYRFVLRKFPVKTNRFVFAAKSFPGETFVRGAADFPVKLTMGIFYYQPIWKLGDITINDRQLKTLGYTMQSLDSGLIGSSGNVTVLYHQNIVALTPSVTFGYSPLDGRVDLSFRVSPFILLSQTGGLRLRMENNSTVDWAPRNGISLDAVIPLSTYGVNAQFNGETIRDTPFHFKCVMFTFRIGLRIVG